MTETCSVRTFLTSTGLTLPSPKLGLANYHPYRVSGSHLYISGQGPVYDGHEVTGQLGHTITTEDGYEAAKAAALNILALVGVACDNDFDRVKACIKLGGFVNAMPGFMEHPQVINGASDLIVNALGERGRHARFAVGVSSLPRGWAVELDAIFEVAY